MTYIVIDRSKCKSCYLCMEVCPNKRNKKSGNVGKTGEYTIELVDTENKCTGCARCAMMCPDIAITGVYKE